MKMSLIVPTFNRSKYLKRSLPSFINQSLKSTSYEIIIVDNNSDDDTRDIVGSIMKRSRCKWRYCVEKKQGLHNARNRGILESDSEIVVFGDDDIIASRNWLQFLLNEYISNKNAGIVGGKIVPQWEEKPPNWVFDWGNEKMHTVFAYLDNGNQRLSRGDYLLFGCNFSIRKNLAIKIGGSLPDTFPKNKMYLSGSGEVGMIDQVLQLGYEVIYQPDAQVSHLIAPSRITLRYFLERYERFGIESVYAQFRKTECCSQIMVRSCMIFFRAFFNLIKSQVNPKAKENKRYFNKIMRKYYLSQIKQTIRVLRNKQLYDYIKKKNYLTELTDSCYE